MGWVRRLHRVAPHHKAVSFVFTQTVRLALLTFAIGVGLSAAGCSKKATSVTAPTDTTTPRMTIAQTLSDGAQRNTIAFDGLAFLTGNLGSQSFLPPGKVADYSGFQYLRDNDPTNLGHNTDFVTIVAFNVLHILSSTQVAEIVELMAGFSASASSVVGPPATRT